MIILFALAAFGLLVSDTLVETDHGIVCQRDMQVVHTAWAGDLWAGWTQRDARQHVELGYCVSELSAEHREAALRALRHWGFYVQMTLTEQPPDALRTLRFQTIPLSSRTLARAYYPFAGEPWSGDVQLNSNTDWGSIDVYSVLLHEIGHALGLGHSQIIDAVMFPYYKPVKGLRWWDIIEAGRLYLVRVGPGELKSGSMRP